MAWIKKKGSTATSAPAAAANALPDTPAKADAQTIASSTPPAAPDSAAEAGGSAPQAGGRPLPPFICDPVVLSASRHGQWRLLPGGVAFAGEATSIPLVSADFAGACRSYPILFAAGEATPVALVGLERTNLFVTDGRWAEGAYVPAYVRRHPFVLVESPDRSAVALGVDAASGLVAKDPGAGGTPLFEGGQPSAATLRALELCRLFSQDHARTRAFSQALAQEGLLVERRANVTLANGRPLAVAGFHVVDPERFAQLAQDTVVAWHRNGWTALVHFHLASLERFSDLLTRQNHREVMAVA